MNQNGKPGADREGRLSEVLADWLEAAERGRPPDEADYLRRYPEFAGELAGCFADWKRFPRPGGPTARPLAAPEPLLPEGGTLGDFRILREVGRGGMGVVYEAEQVSLGRRVALQVLPLAGTMDPRRLQRFHNEAKAAACLHHTHIVPVFAVGSERGVPFYAMQLIDGVSLAAALQDLRPTRKEKDESRDGPATTPYSLQGGAAAPSTAPVAALSTSKPGGDAAYFQRVAELAAQAAEALDYAHQMGVVHRDVKPANLLLDGRGGLWVTDFGLAQLQADSGLTLTGDLVGTLRYMSPEQALAKRVVIDHRTDVYSLGATLYELLTLRPVFGGGDRQELLRQIAFEEPARPRRVNKAVPAELETITLKALEKNPADRYGMAQELADDLRRFLDDKPIKARRPSLAQRAGKWGRRNRRLVAVTAVILVLMVFGLAVSTALLTQANTRAEDNLVKAREALARASRAQAKAETEKAKAEAVTYFLVDDLLLKATPSEDDPYEGNPDANVTVAELLKRAAAKIDTAFPNQPEVEAKVRETVGAAYGKLGLYAEGEPHLRRAVDLYRTSVGPEDVSTLRATDHLIFLLGQRNEDDQAEALGVPNVEACRRLLGPDHYLTDRAMVHMVDLLRQRHKIAEAVALLRRHVESLLRVRRDGPGVDPSQAMASLSALLGYQGNYAEAEILARYSVEFQHSLRNRYQVSLVVLLAVILQDQQRHDEAEAIMRQAVDRGRRDLGPANVEVAHAIRWQAHLLRRQGKSAEAEPLLREALETYRSLLGPKEPGRALRATMELTWDLIEQGKFAEAEPVAREALPALRELHGHPHADGLVALGAILTATGRKAEAEPLLREAVAIRRRLPSGHPLRATAESLLGNCLAAQRRYAEAEPLLVAGHEALQKAAYPDYLFLPRWRREAHERLVKLYETWEKPDKAREWRAKDVPVKDRRVPPEKRAAALREARQKLYRLLWETCITDAATSAATYHNYAWLMATSFDPELRDPQMAVQMARKAAELEPTRWEVWDVLGTAQYRAGEPKAAVEAFQKAMQIKGEGILPTFFLAIARWQLGDTEQARQQYDRAAQWMDEHQPKDEQLLRSRAEAAALLGIKGQPPGNKGAPPATPPGP
jgi:serine/threonine protein kinase/tetratricopeptide (TPR) repeat protein